LLSVTLKKLTLELVKKQLQLHIFKIRFIGNLLFSRLLKCFEESSLDLNLGDTYFITNMISQTSIIKTVTENVKLVKFWRVLTTN